MEIITKDNFKTLLFFGIFSLSIKVDNEWKILTIHWVNSVKLTSVYTCIMYYILIIYVNEQSLVYNKDLLSCCVNFIFFSLLWLAVKNEIKPIGELEIKNKKLLSARYFLLFRSLDLHYLNFDSSALWVWLSNNLCSFVEVSVWLPVL